MSEKAELKLPFDEIRSYVEMVDFKEVSKEEFYNYLGPRNVVYEVVGDRYPYIGHWKTRRGEIVGKTIPYGRQLGIMADKKKYYLRQIDES